MIIGCVNKETISMAGIHYGTQIFKGKTPNLNYRVVYYNLQLSNGLPSSSLNSMATLFSSASVLSNLCSLPDQIKFNPAYRSIDRQKKEYKLRCDMKNSRNTSSSSSTSNQESEPENLLLKIAWYGSELLGIAASFIRSPKNVESPQETPVLAVDGFGVIDRNTIVETIKDDFERSYFVTGNLTLDAYEEDCEFADPAGSFRGLRRFKRNCTNFGSLLERSNMKLMKWEDFEEKAIGHWRFSCTLSFPWKPILSATGYTEYYFNEQSGKVCRHVEHWNVPKMILLKQILKPGRGFMQKRSSDKMSGEANQQN